MTLASIAPDKSSAAPWPVAGTPIGAALSGSGLAAVDARLLLAHALLLSRTQLITQSGRQLTASEAALVADLFARRQAGEPVAYLLGQREFYGLAFKVNPAVLIPRPDTELLVELAADRLPPGGHALDLGTGSGAIAVTLAHLRSDATVSAVDVSLEALSVARLNAAQHQVPVTFMHSDWFGSIPSQVFDLLVANPPYIVEDDPHLQQGDLRFEPLHALTDHADGLSCVRTIIEQAPPYLKTDGWLLLEHGYDQAPAVRRLLTTRGFSDVQSWADLAGIARVSGGRLP